MNKLLYVNIGGVVFQIDETAYSKLDAYLNNIRRKYASTTDGEEIVKDIENRIAELFHEKVGERGAITSLHVDDIISVMGKPEDFASEQTKEENIYEPVSGKRRGTKFFRDKENNILGGVCAGFAAKFDIDVLWIRLAFLISFFVFGTGFLLYIILWIIMPEAKTTAEKLEMRGERVNIDNIERTVRDGADQFKKKAGEFGEELKETFSKERIDKTKRNAGDFVESAVATLKPIAKTLLQIFAGFIALVCLVILVAIGVALLSDAGQLNEKVQFLSDHVIGSGKMSWVLVVSALSLAIIPVAGLLFSVSKYLLGIKKRFRVVTITLSFLWFAAFTATIVSGIKLGLNFREEAAVSSTMPVSNPSSGVLYINTIPLEVEYRGKGKHYKNGWEDIFIENDSAYFQNISVSIEQSVDSNFSVITTKHAKGNTYEEAKTRAREFDFYAQQNDSVLTIPGGRALLENELWRDQKVEVTLRIPQNKFVVLDKDLDIYLSRNATSKGFSDEDLYGKKLMMTAGGLMLAK